MTEGNFLSTLVYQSDDLSFTLETTGVIRATLVVKKQNAHISNVHEVCG